MHKLSIKIPVYNSTCHVIIDDDIKKTINRYVKKKGWDAGYSLTENEEVDGFALTTEQNSYYCFYEKKQLTANLVTHEITHLVDFILTEKGVELVGESRAYITAHISEKIFDFIIKNKLLINKWLEKETKKTGDIPV